jgi:hypothetical protein
VASNDAGSSQASTVIRVEADTGISLDSGMIGGYWTKYIMLAFIIIIIAIVAIIGGRIRNQEESAGLSIEQLIEVVGILAIIIIMFIVVSFLLNAFSGLI